MSIYALPFLLLIFTESPVPRFVDRTPDAELSVVTYSGSSEKNHILESTGHGLLVLDYDRDGYQDLYLVSAYRFPERGEEEPHPNALYRNLGDGTFADVTEQAGVGAAAYGQGGCVGDFDSNGFADIYVTAYGSNILYRNNGDGTFSDVTGPAGVGDPRWSIGATFFDADGDGDHDLFVANYVDASWEEVHAGRRTRMWRGKVAVMDGPRGLAGSKNSFYVNQGDGSFKETTDAAGLGTGGIRYSMGVSSFDYDRDGDVDLFVANDSTPNGLYRNRGDGSFEEIGTQSGFAYNADGSTQASMGIHFGDYNGDGWLDLVSTNFANDYYTVYRNLAGELFLDDSFSVGVAVESYVPLGWGTFFFDADNDGDLDLFFANGHIYPQVDEDPSLYESFRQGNQLFVNERGKFRDASDEAGDGLTASYSSRGAVYADLDNDGDLDIVVSNQDAQPTYLENQTLEDTRWVLLELVDSAGASLALGARVELKAGGRAQVHQISSGGSYASQSDLRIHFGLGDETRIEELVVTWPDGAREVHRGLSADRFYVIKRGTEPLIP